ncbi:hypothetical protein [Paractinoplanes durhamensis]|uniref:hypothetical protein n=1 Tax=Paractinoplanes durhamensis TaxID=113563 RepID=UPI003634C49C
MTPVRSLAASVVALGFAGTIAAPMPANAALVPCERAENYAAQSGAEALRIDKLEIRAEDRGSERPVTKAGQSAEKADEDSGGEGAADRILGTGAAAIDPTAGGEDADTLSEGIGILGEAVLDSVDPHGVIPRAKSQPFSARSSADPESHSDGDTGGQGGGEMGTGDQGGGQGGGEEDKTVTVREVGVGEARTALIGPAAVKSAAVARILDGKVSGKDSWTKPAVQQAPPSHATAATRTTAGGQAGPLKIGAGAVSAHARWDAGMACGRTPGRRLARSPRCAAPRSSVERRARWSGCRRRSPA